jgi:hypothetical protein
MSMSNHTELPRRLPSHVFHDSVPYLDLRSLTAARAELGQFARDLAARTSSEVGFGWQADSSAPLTYVDLRAAYTRCSESHDALPVRPVSARDDLLPDETSELAMRFWHDASQVRRNQSRRLVDEIDLGLWQVALATEQDLSQLAVRLLEADVTGCPLLYGTTCLRPTSRLRFALDAITFGIADAICLEQERQPRCGRVP